MQKRPGAVLSLPAAKTVLSTRRAYPHPLKAEAYPDFSRRPFRAPALAAFGDRTQFAALRWLHQSTWREDLDLYTKEFGLGRVVCR